MVMRNECLDAADHDVDHDAIDHDVLIMMAVWDIFLTEKE